jgi:hypothetical protein
MFNVSMRVPTMRMRMMVILRIMSVGGHPFNDKPAHSGLK